MNDVHNNPQPDPYHSRRPDPYNDLCIDMSWGSLNKYGEQLCGDHVETIEQGSSMIFVLADGLGSGVKASILSILTAKIISTMMAHSMSLEECVSTIASTLPVCQKRKIAYSTFTILRITNHRKAEIIQYDNPPVILLQNGKNHEYPKEKLEIDGKLIYRSKLDLTTNDIFVIMSDGAVYAGVGHSLNFGWQRENIIKYMEKRCQEICSARSITTLLLDACNRLYEGMPGDDTTIGVIRMRKRKQVNLLIGPPRNPLKDQEMMSRFFSEKGSHIVCGGTTSSIAARFLGKDIQTGPDYMDPKIPPIAKIEGVDLVTEGIITINQVLRYARSDPGNQCSAEWSGKKDGASRIARILLEEATDIHFFVGRAVNPAHQNPDLPVDFNLKMRLVDELAKRLKKIGKKIDISYY